MAEPPPSLAAVFLEEDFPVAAVPLPAEAAVAAVALPAEVAAVASLVAVPFLAVAAEVPQAAVTLVVVLHPFPLDCEPVQVAAAVAPPRWRRWRWWRTPSH